MQHVSIPNAIFQRLLGWSDAQVRALLAVASTAGADGKATVGDALLVRLTGVSRDTLTEMRRRLVASGLGSFVPGSNAKDPATGKPRLTSYDLAGLLAADGQTSTSTSTSMPPSQTAPASNDADESFDPEGWFDGVVDDYPTKRRGSRTKAFQAWLECVPDEVTATAIDAALKILNAHVNDKYGGPMLEDFIRGEWKAWRTDPKVKAQEKPDAGPGGVTTGYFKATAENSTVESYGPTGKVQL